MKNPTLISDKFVQYVGEVIKDTRSSLTQDQTRKVFLLALNDFFEEKISFSDLSDIATQLYYTIGNSIATGWEHDLGNALSDATEIDYYNRESQKEEGAKGMYEAMFKNIKEYYEKNKHLLKKDQEPLA